jgi:hypothetical protein
MSPDAGTASEGSRKPIGLRRFGYVVTIVLSVVVVYLANNIVAWGWFPWLTADFDEVVPYISVAVIASIVVNAIYIVHDAAWLKAIGETISLVLTVIANVQLLRVFPFDYSAYQWNWAGIVRVALILATIGMIAGIIAQVATLVRAIVAQSDASRSAP